MANSVDPDEMPHFTASNLGLQSTLFAQACLTKYIKSSIIQLYMSHAQTDRQTGKIMTISSVITNRLSITMAGLIIDYLFSSDEPALIFLLAITIFQIKIILKVI